MKNEGRAFHAEGTPAAKTLKIHKKLVQGNKVLCGCRLVSTENSIIKCGQRQEINTWGILKYWSTMKHYSAIKRNRLTTQATT